MRAVRSSSPCPSSPAVDGYGSQTDCSPENPIYLLTYIHVLIGALSAFFFFPQNCRHEICPASIDRDGREAVGSDNTVLYTNFNLANTN